MIRILHVGLSSNPGGVENMVMNYYRHINCGEYAFDFLDPYGDGLAYADENESLCGYINSLSNNKRRPMTASRKLSLMKPGGPRKTVLEHTMIIIFPKWLVN